MKYFVYKITNIINGNIYIGCTSDFDARINRHFYLANKNQHDSKLLNDDFKEGGFSAFKCQVLFENKNKKLALKKEVDLIKELNPKYNSARKKKNRCEVGYQEKIELQSRILRAKIKYPNSLLSMFFEAYPEYTDFKNKKTIYSVYNLRAVDALITEKFESILK